MKITDIIKPNKKWLVASVLIVSACAGVATSDVATQPGGQSVDETTPNPTVNQETSSEDEAVTDANETPSALKVLPDFWPDEPPP